MEERLPKIEEGPFLITLKTGDNPAFLRRVSLGGVKGSGLKLPEAFKKINQLQDGLNITELSQAAREIFNSQGLFEIRR